MIHPVALMVDTPKVELSPQSQQLLRCTMLLTLGQVTSYGLSFIRNVILARMLTKVDFGLAAMFGMTLSLLEVSGRMSFGQQIIQSKDGNAESFQATSHTFQFMLSVIGAFLVAALSHPLAYAFKVPHFAWAFSLLAFVPLARGFENLDYFRQQRELNYLPVVLCELVPQTVVTLAAWPLAVWLGDFRVIIWVMLGKAGLGILMTQWLARRPYRWAWRRDYMKVMWIFGWPLLLNGLLMFASQQADQVIVGAFLSLNELAPYALVLSLVSIPWFVFGQVGSSILLPILSRIQDEPERFRCKYRAGVEYAGVGAVILMLPLIVAGEQLVTILFGPKYVGTGPLMALLGAAAAVRFLRFVPSVAAMARADTMNQLYSNIWRSLGLPLAFAVAALGGGVNMIAACALLAELVASGFSVLQLRRCQGVPLRDTAGAAIYVLGFVAVGLVTVCLGASHWSICLAAVAALTMLVFSIVFAWISFPNLARMVQSAIAVKRFAGVPNPTNESIL